MYFRARYYDPATGRFVQRDPVWDPGNFGNQYSFVGNSPASGRDPEGLNGTGQAPPPQPGGAPGGVVTPPRFSGGPKSSKPKSKNSPSKRLILYFDKPSWERWSKDQVKRGKGAIEAHKLQGLGDLRGFAAKNKGKYAEIILLTHANPQAFDLGRAPSGRHEDVDMRLLLGQTVNTGPRTLHNWKTLADALKLLLSKNARAVHHYGCNVVGKRHGELWMGRTAKALGVPVTATDGRVFTGNIQRDHSITFGNLYIARPEKQGKTRTDVVVDRSSNPYRKPMGLTDDLPQPLDWPRNASLNDPKRKWLHMPFPGISGSNKAK